MAATGLDHLWSLAVWLGLTAGRHGPRAPDWELGATAAEIAELVVKRKDAAGTEIAA
jgi:hypothetical protein